MRIAIDLTSLDDNFSGIERYAMNIAKELIELDKKRENTYILLFKRKIHPDIDAVSSIWDKSGCLFVPGLPKPCFVPA